MIIVMRNGASNEDLAAVKKRIKELGYKPHVIHGDTRNVVGAVGDERGKAVLQSIESMSGVENVVPILKPYKLASKEVKLERTTVEIAPGIAVGGDHLIVMAGAFLACLTGVKSVDEQLSIELLKPRAGSIRAPVVFSFRESKR